jgi:Asp/Glu/hydantoin racemase
MSACLLGGAISIIAISQRITAWYPRCVQANGLGRPARQHPRLDQPLRDIGAVPADHESRLRALCRCAVEDDGADVIIIAGAPLAGLARAIRADVPVPLVDGVSSAVRHAETLVRWRQAAHAAAATRRRRPSRTRACRRRCRRCSPRSQGG